MSYLEQLNENQYEAVTAPLGPVRVLAGAGSGKTRVLISRITWLIETGQAEPHGILAVTFTNKAAFEMRSRLESTLKLSIRGMWIGTFHSLCHRMLRAHYREAGLIENFQIMDSDDQLRLCRRIVRAKEMDEKLYPPKLLASFINGNKEEGRRAEHLEAYGDYMTQNLIMLYQEYQNICNQSGLVDFAEILLRTVELLRSNALLLKHYQSRFKFILVDEFQDTNSVQYAWLQLLSGQYRNLFVVGDDDQSIYGWRGAKIENILHFDRDFPDVTTVRLEQNYRSTKAILSAANAVIAKNTQRLDKALWTENDSAELITVYRGLDGHDEARYVIETIKERIKEGYRKSDMAILYRSNAQSRLFEEFLLRAQIPYRVYGGLRFFDRAEIKDVMAYLRMVNNPHDDVSLERSMTTPPKGIGPATMEQLREYATMHRLSLWDSLQYLLESQTLTTRVHNVLLAYYEQITDLMRQVEVMALDQFFNYVIERSNLKAHYKKEPLNRGEDRIDNLNELVSAASYYMTEDQQALAFEERLERQFDAELMEGAGLAPLDVEENEAVAEALELGTLDLLTENAPEEETITMTVVDDEAQVNSRSTKEMLEAFMGQTALDSSDTQASADEDSVQLMTLHASKGLEFPIVFLVGMEDGLFPSDPAIMDSTRLEEERRLAYVGITRAEKHLYLLGVEQRMLYGKTMKMSTSRFLRDIPENLLNVIGPAVSMKPFGMQSNSLNSGSGTAVDSEMGDYQVGQSVMHPKFGEGVIMGFEGVGASTRVIVQFAEAGRKVLVLGYARLTVI